MQLIKFDIFQETGGQQRHRLGKCSECADVSVLKNASRLMATKKEEKTEKSAKEAQETVLYLTSGPVI